MPRSIPTNPSVRFLQKEAKDILNSHKAGKDSCCPTLRYHFRFSRSSDEEILNAKVTLQEVQHALALDYGFKSWKQLKSSVENSSPVASTTNSAGKFIQDILERGVKGRASDIHIEPMTKTVQVRSRIDGDLRETALLSREEGLPIIEEAMRLAMLDPGESNKGQDGRMMFTVDGHRIDVRVNASPVIHGHSIAMRLLDRSQIDLSLEALGMEPEQLEFYKKQITRSHGLILVSGPTGSGKTTTMYSTLKALNDRSRKIMTVEDPVELALEGIDQIAVKPGFGFEQALRGVLRQGVNIIMAGEIRTLETAQLLVQASLTGYLVFSALHTNDGPGTLMRLSNIGIEEYLITDTVRCIVDQSLIKLVCEDCKEEHKLEDGEFNSLQLSDDDRSRPIYRGKGCDQCSQTGYKGRGAVYSMLEMTPALARQVAKKDEEAIRAAAREDGWTSLREAAIRKMFRGETTPEQVLKFT